MEKAVKVMVVDDDREVLSVMAYGLESYGYQVRTCENATEALLLALTDPCEFVITDHDMPGMDGVELTRRLRGLLPAAVIIGMSGRDHGMVFLRAGANDFVQKPFVPYDLVMMIDGRDLSS
ncbi:MAG: response regulator [Nitrospirota bacterium]